MQCFSVYCLALYVVSRTQINEIKMRVTEYLHIRTNIPPPLPSQDESEHWA